MSKTNNTIDINLYDRQVRTYGIEAVKKITTSSVLIMGLSKGLGTEIGKNLALGGIKNIYLYDSELINSSDLETGIYYTTESIGSIRSSFLINKLQELNPYVTIHSVNSYQQNQNVTIVINQSTEIVETINNYCRDNKSKMIALYSKGISGTIFVDAGNSHLVTDTTGEIIEPVQIGEISIDGKVRCAQNSSHDFQSGDFIKFENLQGENIQQLEKEWKIKVINNVTFQLEDFLCNSPFTFINGTAIQIKKPIEVQHQSWNQQIKEPTLAFSFDIDNSKKIVETYLQMFKQNLITSMPPIWSPENKPFMETHNISLPEQARTFNFELIPVVSLMGSIAASEAIKLVTNKYMPVNQWFTWTDPILVPKTESSNYLEAKTAYGILWGNEFENKLINSKWFIIGSGAIGCEYLKNLAFMNVANHDLGTDGLIIITDPDSIEKSNLNRQFLFRSEHIGKPKSITATNAIKQMKPKMNINAVLEKVGSDNSIFTDTIMSSQITGVLNALDNTKARRFMDEQCFKYGLPLFESGTTGTKGNTQPVIPFITETYSNSVDAEEEKSFPICTIKSFPNEITHTIHWAMDQFEFFNRAPSTLNKWIKNPNYLNELGQIEQSIAKEDIIQYTIKYPTQQTKLIGCAQWAVDMFTENYYNSIIQLLHTFSPNHEVSPGVPFWSAGKRCPTAIKFDIENSLHLDYIEATTHLLARTSGLEDTFTRKELVEMISNYKPKEFVPKEMKIAANDSELEKINEIVLNINNVINNNINIVHPHVSELHPKKFKPCYVAQDFEKDDDSNWHINWVTATSNIRAINYGIPIVDRQQTKGIAGRIIPAIATTTSAVSGLILLEMLKYLQGLNNLDVYRSTFINLAEPILIYSEPIKASMIDIAGIKINSWTKFDYEKNSTLGEFKKYYEEIFKCEINMIVIGTAMIYAEFIDNNDILSKSMFDIINETFKYIPSNVTFIIACDDESKELPNINVNLTI